MKKEYIKPMAQDEHVELETFCLETSNESASSTDEVLAPEVDDELFMSITDLVMLKD
ncbi:MAG: hypothetical protein GXY64_07405 [Bacteroidales bacterium]|nr:hypothetical protein [Bacteroidales bacterium]